MDNLDHDEAYRILDTIYNNNNNNNKVNNNIHFSEETEKLLLSHQHMHIFNMINALNDKNNNAILDGSYTGTGKTYTTSAICKEVNRRPFIICLKSNISTWERVLKIFDVDPIAVVNYDLVRTGKYYKDGEITKCPYLVRDKTRFKWDFSEIGKKNMVMVFDEVHVCKNKGTLNSKLLTSCKAIKTIMLSATLCDKIEDFGVFGMMLAFYSTVGVGKNWMQNVIRRERCRLESKDKNTKSFVTNILHREIYNMKGSRMSLEDIGNDMSKDQINIECYTISKTARLKIDKLYEDITDQKRKMEEINENTNDISDKIPKNKKASALQAITYKREKIENLKSDIILEQAYSYYESRKSVVIFVNYRSSHDIICKGFDKIDVEYAEIHGRQTSEERDINIQMFQRNEVRIMVAMSKAGGTSISLDDTTGKFPRVSIISPSYSVLDLVQSLGRIRRSNTKSPTIQKIVYCSDTIEEHIAAKVREKEEIVNLTTGESSTKIFKNEEEEEEKEVSKTYTLDNIAISNKIDKINNRLKDKPLDKSQPIRTRSRSRRGHIF
jgi:superfamily II DNA or RNA helicase